jgi:hypothetical protein
MRPALTTGRRNGTERGGFLLVVEIFDARLVAVGGSGLRGDVRLAVVRHHIGMIDVDG